MVNTGRFSSNKCPDNGGYTRASENFLEKKSFPGLKQRDWGKDRWAFVWPSPDTSEEMPCCLHTGGRSGGARGPGPEGEQYLD